MCLNVEESSPGMGESFTVANTTVEGLTGWGDYTFLDANGNSSEIPLFQEPHSMEVVEVDEAGLPAVFAIYQRNWDVACTYAGFYRADHETRTIERVARVPEDDTSSECLESSHHGNLRIIEDANGKKWLIVHDAVPAVTRFYGESNEYQTWTLVAEFAPVLGAHTDILLSSIFMEIVDIKDLYAGHAATWRRTD
jgi:hypothetical protein